MTPSEEKAWHRKTAESTIQSWINTLSPKEKFFMAILQECDSADLKTYAKTADLLDIPEYTWATLANLEAIRIIACSLDNFKHHNHQDINRRLFATLLATFEEFAGLTPKDLEEVVLPSYDEGAK